MCRSRLLAHAHYARYSAPAFLALHFKGFRICRPHPVVNDASPVVSRSISSDCRAAPSSVGTSGGLDRWCRLVGVTTPCSTGTMLFCKQEVDGFGTDPQMPAVPYIASSVCFHLKGLRRNCPLHPGLPPYPLPCPYWLHTNGVEVSSSLGAWMVP